MFPILNCFFPLSDEKLVNTVHEDPPINSVKLVLQELFFNLDLPSLAKSCRVCKSWNNAGSEPLVWKTVIFRHSFNNDKWARCFGAKVVEDEDREEEWTSLPITIVDEYRKFHRAYPKIKFQDGLMLVRLPKTLNGGLNLKSFGELTNAYFPRTEMGYRFCDNSIFRELGDQSIPESRWVLMTKGNLPDFHITDDEQSARERLTRKGLRGSHCPLLLEAVVCISAQFFDSNTRLFDDTNFSWAAFFGTSRYYILCMEMVQNRRVVVGNFAGSGLGIYRISNDIFNRVGVGFLKRFIKPCEVTTSTDSNL